MALSREWLTVSRLPGPYFLPSILEGSWRVQQYRGRSGLAGRVRNRKFAAISRGESACVRCRKYVVNRILRTILDEDVENIIHHLHPSSAEDFPKNMKMEEGKKIKRVRYKKVKLEESEDEGKESGKDVLKLGGIMKLIPN